MFDFLLILFQAETIFASVKTMHILREIQNFSSVTKFIIEQFVFKSKAARKKSWEHWRYTADRVDRRLAREPDHPDLWTKVLEADEKENGLSADEHQANGALFMMAGTETLATVSLLV